MANGSYAATVIFFLTVLAICLYAFLRESGINRLMVGSGALLAAPPNGTYLLKMHA
jgi:hypothetical protein